MSKRSIALLSNVTLDMVAHKLKKQYDVYIPNGFDMWISDVMNMSSHFYTGEYDAVFVLLDGIEIQSMKNIDAIESKISMWKTAIEKLIDNITHIPIFISTIDFRENRIKTYAERKYYLTWEHEWYQYVQSLVETNLNIYVIDLLQKIMDHGREHFYSTKMWYMGSMPYSKEGINVITREIMLAMEAAYGQHRKVIVLDLDNTLWGGVIGEDGLQGIELSEHKEGERFYDFQYQLLEMKNRGIVLAINSKNNKADVEQVFNRHKSMLLKKDDFVCRKINWKNKASNIKEMEIELNLTEGSFLFIDDNPIERQIVAGECPEVCIPDFPEDTTTLLSFAESIYEKYFRSLRITDEDSKKTQMYLNEAKRKEIQSQKLNLDDYIKMLEIEIDMHFMKNSEQERVYQLCNKTNQFNLTTKRYSFREIQQMDGDIFTVVSSDKFGDNGLIAVVICKNKISDNRQKKIEIDTFLMSCRVMGRNLENVIIGLISRHYEAELEGVFIKTAKNVPVENLYDSLGFDLQTTNGNEKRYTLSCDKKISYPDSYKQIIFNGIVMRDKNNSVDHI